MKGLQVTVMLAVENSGRAHEKALSGPFWKQIATEAFAQEGIQVRKAVHDLYRGEHTGLTSVLTLSVSHMDVHTALEFGEVEIALYSCGGEVPTLRAVAVLLKRLDFHGMWLKDAPQFQERGHNYSNNARKKGICDRIGMLRAIRRNCRWRRICKEICGST